MSGGKWVASLLTSVAKLGAAASTFAASCLAAAVSSGGIGGSVTLGSAGSVTLGNAFSAERKRSEAAWLIC